jgi:hypothetical protein
MAKTARKKTTPTPTTIPMIRPALFFLGLVFIVVTKSIQV